MARLRGALLLGGLALSAGADDPEDPPLAGDIEESALSRHKVGTHGASGLQYNFVKAEAEEMEKKRKEAKENPKAHVPFGDLHEVMAQHEALRQMAGGGAKLTGTASTASGQTFKISVDKGGAALNTKKLLEELKKLQAAVLDESARRDVEIPTVAPRTPLTEVLAKIQGTLWEAAEEAGTSGGSGDSGEGPFDDEVQEVPLKPMRSIPTSPMPVGGGGLLEMERS